MGRPRVYKVRILQITSSSPPDLYCTAGLPNPPSNTHPNPLSLVDVMLGYLPIVASSCPGLIIG